MFHYNEMVFHDQKGEMPLGEVVLISRLTSK